MENIGNGLLFAITPPEAPLKVYSSYSCFYSAYRGHSTSVTYNDFLYSFQVRFQVCLGPDSQSKRCLRRHSFKGYNCSLLEKQP